MKTHKKQIVKEIKVTYEGDCMKWDAVCYTQKARIPRKLKKKRNA